MLLNLREINRHVNLLLCALYYQNYRNLLSLFYSDNFLEHPSFCRGLKFAEKYYLR